MLRHLSMFFFGLCLVGLLGCGPDVKDKIALPTGPDQPGPKPAGFGTPTKGAPPKTGGSGAVDAK